MYRTLVIIGKISPNKANKTPTCSGGVLPRGPTWPAGWLGLGQRIFTLVHDILRRCSQLGEFYHLLIVSAHTETMTWSSMFFLLLCVLGSVSLCQ